MSLISLSQYVRIWREQNRNPPMVKQLIDYDGKTHVFGGIDIAGDAVCAPNCWCYNKGEEE